MGRWPPIIYRSGRRVNRLAALSQSMGGWQLHQYINKLHLMREWRNGSRARLRIWWVKTRAGSSPAFRTICSGSSSGKNTLRIRVILVRIQYGTIGHYPSLSIIANIAKKWYSTIFGLHFLLLGNLKNVPFIHQTLTTKLWWAFVDDQADSPPLLEFVGEIRTLWCRRCRNT